MAPAVIVGCDWQAAAWPQKRFIDLRDGSAMNSMGNGVTSGGNRGDDALPSVAARRGITSRTGRADRRACELARPAHAEPEPWSVRHLQRPTVNRQHPRQDRQGQRTWL